MIWICFQPGETDDDACVCGLTYDRFRTGLSYAEVHSQLWTDSEDRSLWVHKGRHAVLGRWREIKQTLWHSHTAECEHHQRGDPEGFDEWIKAA